MFLSGTARHDGRAHRPCAHYGRSMNHGSTDHGYGVTSEVGVLRTVMLHRPGPELRRLTPRNSDQLLFDGIPWVERAQQEHDMFADVLRGRGVEVLLLADLLAETLAVSGAARIQGISAAVDARRLGHTLADEIGRASCRRRRKRTG